MNTRIRHISHRRKGLVVQSEQVLNKQTINVGRATDQDVFLSDIGVAYKHARISLSSNGQVAVTSLAAAGLTLNGKFRQSGSFKDNGEFQVGPFNIVIQYQSEDFDFDITVEQIAVDVVEIQNESQPAMRLEDTWLSRRRGAWLGFALILAIFLAFPLAGYFDKNIAQQERANHLIPDDSSWLSGEISSPHKHFAKQCDSCHLKAFEQVPDKACVSCHAKTTVHADPEFFDLHALQGVGCGSCHKEHNGDDYLIRTDQSLCSDCHKNLRSTVESSLENTSDFATQHFEFKPYLFTRELANGDRTVASLSEWRRVSLNSNRVSHETGLIFPHKTHLDENGVESPTGNRVLQCSSCHQTDVSGRYMLPIEFESDCQSCHELTFDPNVPDRVLPHSNLAAMSATLDEYYAYVALRGNYQNDDMDVPDSIQRRRIPGKELTVQEVKTALSWAKETAAEVKEEIIEFRSCGYCHAVTRDETDATGWNIPDVKVSQRWLTKSSFDHVVHRATQCEDCHQASQSEYSEDLIMPGIDVCRECHGGEHSEDKLASGCVTCHVFHTPDAVLLGDRDNGNAK